MVSVYHNHGFKYRQPYKSKAQFCYNRRYQKLPFLLLRVNNVYKI